MLPSRPRDSPVDPRYRSNRALSGNRRFRREHRRPAAFGPRADAVCRNVRGCGIGFCAGLAETVTIVRAMGQPFIDAGRGFRRRSTNRDPIDLGDAIYYLRFASVCTRLDALPAVGTIGVFASLFGVQIRTHRCRSRRRPSTERQSRLRPPDGWARSVVRRPAPVRTGEIVNIRRTAGRGPRHAGDHPPGGSARLMS